MVLGKNVPDRVLVVDANVIIASLMKNSFVRRIILEEDTLNLIAPEFIKSEIEKYAIELSERIGISENQFKESIKELFQTTPIITIPKKEYEMYLKKADNISPDPNDSPYFAVALKFSCPIWTHDKKLKNQKIVRVYHTKEIIPLMKTKKPMT